MSRTVPVTSSLLSFDLTRRNLLRGSNKKKKKRRQKGANRRHSLNPSFFLSPYYNFSDVRHFAVLQKQKFFFLFNSASYCFLANPELSLFYPLPVFFFLYSCYMFLFLCSFVTSHKYIYKIKQKGGKKIKKTKI